MGILYGCQDGLVAMHKAGLTLSAAMARLIQNQTRSKESIGESRVDGLDEDKNDEDVIESKNGSIFIFSHDYFITIFHLL